MQTDLQALRRLLPNTISLVAVLLTLSVAAWAREQAQPTGTGLGPSSPVVIFAIDGLEWSLLDRFTAEGICPNLARLVRGGTRGYLVSTEASKSPVIWTTIATGRPSSEHGITDFVINGVLAASTQRRKRAFWEIADTQGIRTATVGWYVTWPAEQVRGYLISDRAEFFRAIAKPAWPPQLKYWMGHYWWDLARSDTRRFTTAMFEPNYRQEYARGTSAYGRNFLLQDRLVTVFKRDRGYAELGLDLIRDRTVRLFALYLRGIDFTCHGFWKYFEPAYFPDVTGEEVGTFGRIIPEYYRYVDEIIGRYLRLLPAESTVIVISDHGFGPAVGRWRIVHRNLRYLSGSHREKGVFLIWGGHSAGGGSKIGKIKAIDVLPTLLHLLGLPQARDLPGRLVTQALDRRLAARKPKYVETYERPVPAASKPSASPADREIKRQLRSLGYIK